MSARLSAAFARLKKQKRAAFIPFIMAGDPSLTRSAALLDALPAAGADIIELGIPFSDPMADGPVIAAAGLRALNAGTTVQKVLGLATYFRLNHADVPLVLMGYLNPLHAYGYKNFAKDAARAGVDGVIIVDLPPEEENEIAPLLAKAGIDLIRLIAPTSGSKRITSLLRHASGYVYYIAVAGITGAKGASATEIKKQLSTLRRQTTLPIAVGFGVKTAADVKALARIADGVIVGSAIVNTIATTGGDVEKTRAFIKKLAKR